MLSVLVNRTLSRSILLYDPTVPRWYRTSLRQVLVSPLGHSTFPVPGFVTGTGQRCFPLPSMLVLKKESNLHRYSETAKYFGVSSDLFGS